MTDNKLPAFIQPYFWDVTFEKLDLTKNSRFILKRVLDRGNTTALLWAITHFDHNAIIDLILSSKDISAKTANFWADILNLPKDKVTCLQKPYSRIPFGPSH